MRANRTFIGLGKVCRQTWSDRRAASKWPATWKWTTTVTNTGSALRTPTARRMLCGCRPGSRVLIFRFAADLPLEPWRRAPAHGDLQTALAKHKRKRPRLIRVVGTPVEQPSPEVCSQPGYVLTCAVGMAPTGYAAHVRHRSGECQGSRHKQAFTLRTRSMSVIDSITMSAPTPE
jgi:hypothetical protein